MTTLNTATKTVTAAKTAPTFFELIVRSLRTSGFLDRYNRFEVVRASNPRSPGYDAVLVTVPGAGKLEISAKNDPETGKGNLCMRLVDWARNADYLWFKKVVQPQHAAGYAECFMDLGSDGKIWWMCEMMRRNRVFDSTCATNGYECVSHSFDGKTITVNLKFKNNGECKLTVTLNDNNEAVMALSNAKGLLNKDFTKSPAWNVRSTIFNFLTDTFSDNE